MDAQKLPAFVQRPANKASHILLANPHSFVLFGLLLNCPCGLLEFAVESRLKYAANMWAEADQTTIASSRDGDSCCPCDLCLVFQKIYMYTSVQRSRQRDADWCQKKVDVEAFYYLQCPASQMLMAITGRQLSKIA